MAAQEVPLTGGNVTGGVVRVGDTVRRPAGPQTPAVHALLQHLHAVGFTRVPRPLGLDERGREVLTYLPGVVVHPDPPGSLADLAELGRLCRDLHDASAEFTPPADARWQVVIPDVGADLVVHHDLAAWNLLATPDGGWSIIDWDSAGPGTRLWDLAYAAHSLVPLRAGSADPAARLRALAGGYDLDETQRRRLAELLPLRTAAMRDLLARSAATGTEPWATLAAQGHHDTWARHTAYIEARASTWRAALLG